MPDPIIGATGASPAPSSGANTGASPPPSGGSQGGAPASTGAASQPKKMDMGMAPRQTTVPTSPQAGAQPDAGSTQDTAYDDAWWKQHGDAIFKHERFKELAGYKQKYSELEPYRRLVDQIGGLEELNAFASHLYPVSQHLVGLGPKGNEVWMNEIYPFFQALFSGKPYQPATPASTGEPIEEDPLAPRIEPIKRELQEVKETLKQTQERERRENIQRIQQARIENIQRYEKLMNDRIADEVKDLPEDARATAIDALTELATDTIINKIGEYMPKDAHGNLLNPLDAFSPEAFDATWKQLIQPRVRKLEGFFLTKAKKTVQEGGPALPNTTGGQPPAAKQTPATLNEKARRFAQGIQRLQTAG